MSLFSVCTIMKDEEKNLPRFLDALSGCDVELVLVDTGSSDRSIEIAEEHGVAVRKYEWNNDFSDARNYAASLSGNDLIISLDCDEFVQDLNVVELEKCVRDNPDALGLIRIINYMEPDSEKGAYYDRIARVYDRRKFQFEGKIHEQLRPRRGQDYELEGYYAPIEIIHTGYIQNSEISEEKHSRNVRMLRKELEQDRDNLYLNFQLAQELYNHENYDEAESYFKYVLDSGGLKPGVEYHRLAVMGYTDCLLHQEKNKEALESQKYLETFGYTPDLHFLMGVTYYLNHDFLSSMQEMITATSMNNPAKEGTNTYLPLYYIGIINEQFQNYAEAKKFYQMCGDYEPALERLNAIETGGMNGN